VMVTLGILQGRWGLLLKETKTEAQADERLIGNWTSRAAYESVISMTTSKSGTGADRQPDCVDCS
jgi:hypothetical protein